ncbi:MAG TPA: 50S ribosomal protein L17 [Vicinamibacterales bacterium]|nr:50S ribosomal protein L17 [Vicinamibacterales bacterium]
MRHNVGHRKLGRVTEHRLALLRNQAIALLRHERIETTMPKAKELRPFVERLITIARRGVAAGEAAGKTLHARRLVLAELPDSDVVGKLFETLAPRFADRAGGYTRILRVGYRRGDSAEVAQIELVGSEYNPQAAKAEKEAEGEDAPKKSKGVGERIKQAAQRIRGKGDGGSKGQAGGQTRGKAQRSTTPRKAGGS